MQQLANLFVSHGAVVELEKRIEECEKRHDSSDKKLTNHDDRIAAIEAQYRSLASTVESLNNKIANFKQAPIPQMPLKTVAASSSQNN